MANGVKKIAIFAIMGAFLLISLAGCGKASAAKGSSSSSSSSKATESSTKKSSSVKSSSKSSSSTTKSSVVASSSSVAASSSSVAASSAAPSSSVATTPATTGMNISQIENGNFSSIAGTWKGDSGAAGTLTISPTDIVYTDSIGSFDINNGWFITSSNYLNINQSSFVQDPGMDGSLGWGILASNMSGTFKTSLAFYPAGSTIPSTAQTTAGSDKIMLNLNSGVENFYSRS